MRAWLVVLTSPSSLRLTALSLALLIAGLVSMSSLLSESARAQSAPCPVENSTCPQTTFGWMLFRDGNHGVPDFWALESLQVDEISICPHGVHLVFDVDQGGNRHIAALTFPNPSEELIRERLGLDPTKGRGREQYTLYLDRYEELRTNVGAILGASVGDGRQFSFRRLYPESRPLLRHAGHRLELSWKGRTQDLRGYLDVYFVLPA